MGKIIAIKNINNEKINLTLELDQMEYAWLKGSLEKIHLLSEENLGYVTRLVQRGKRDSTKYLLMPKEFRKEISPSNNVRCNIINGKNKSICIFMINKF